MVKILTERINEEEIENEGKISLYLDLMIIKIFLYKHNVIELR